jgi:hypothetical protein
MPVRDVDGSEPTWPRWGWTSWIQARFDDVTGRISDYVGRDWSADIPTTDPIRPVNLNPDRGGATVRKYPLGDCVQLPDTNLSANVRRDPGFPSTLPANHRRRQKALRCPHRDDRLRTGHGRLGLAHGGRGPGWTPVFPFPFIAKVHAAEALRADLLSTVDLED